MLNVIKSLYQVPQFFMVLSYTGLSAHPTENSSDVFAHPTQLTSSECAESQGTIQVSTCRLPGLSAGSKQCITIYRSMH